MVYLNEDQSIQKSNSKRKNEKNESLECSRLRLVIILNNSHSSQILRNVSVCLTKLLIDHH